MDTCSRLEEPGGVGWKDVIVGRLRTTTSGKRVIWWRRWIEQIGARREPTAAARRPTTQATLPSADHAAEIARLQRENERLRMERDILKKSIAIFAGVQK